MVKPPDPAVREPITAILRQDSQRSLSLSVGAAPTVRTAFASRRDERRIEAPIGSRTAPGCRLLAEHGPGPPSRAAGKNR